MRCSWRQRGRGAGRWTLSACALATLALTAPAQASRPHEFSHEDIGVKCTAEPCTGESLKEPDAVAINEASGDVYVVDRGSNRVVRFGKAGNVLTELKGSSASGTGTLSEGSKTITALATASGQFSVGQEISGAGIPSGTKITALNILSGELELSNAVEAGKSGTLVLLSAQQGFETPEGVAVDNSCLLRSLSKAECEADDPSSGDVYVLDAGHRVIDKYTAAGEYLGQITKAGVPLSNRPLDGVTVDVNGEPWAYRREPVNADGFSNANPNVFLSEIELHQVNGEGFAIPGGGFARDRNGNFYGRLGIPFPPRIVKWSPTGTVLNEKLDGEGSNAVAVEQSPSEDAIVCNATHIDVLNPEAEKIETLGEEHGESHLSECSGLGVSTAAETIYATDAAGGHVAVFGPAKASAPKVEGESFTKVSAFEATIEARINPRSEAKEPATVYSFEYGQCSSASKCKESGYEAVPQGGGELPADFAVHSASAHLKGLDAHTTYHFRVLAGNFHGVGVSEEAIFTTEAAGGERALPDNRAYELVSPPNKQGALIGPLEENGVVQAAAAGGAITYLANATTEPEPEGYTNRVQVLSQRSASAWSTRDVAIAHKQPTGFALGHTGSEYKFFDSQLTLGAVHPFGEFNPSLSSQATEQTSYLRNLNPSCASNCFTPLVTRANDTASPFVPFGEDVLCEPSEAPVASSDSVLCGPEFIGATDSLSRVIVDGFSAPLTAGGKSAELVEWSDGTLLPVSVLPDGEASEAKLGLEEDATRNAISNDGNRISWTAKGNLYLRDMARKETLELDEAEPACKAEAKCTSGGGRFQVASADGARVLFTDANRLTKDAGNTGADLYECQIRTEGGKLACALSDLTPANGGESAGVKGSVLGASEDTATVYFVASGVLSEAANARGQKAQPGKPNLYVHRGGESEFITTLEGDDEHDWEERLALQPTRVSPNGRYLELMSQGSPTGYDNSDAIQNKPDAEVYLYDSVSKQLTCASCEPSGVRPVGVEYHKLESGSGGLVGQRGIWTQEGLVAANVPSWTAISSIIRSRYQPRYLNNEGRLFFDSADALVPQDNNGTEDVYEYEPPAVGNCSQASETFSPSAAGCVSLISSGTSSRESAFLDASESGDDVYFLTAARLSPLDSDNALDVYDAHVCSAGSPCIVYPSETIKPCAEESSCKGAYAPQPQIYGAPASQTIQGLDAAPSALSAPPAAPHKSPEQLRLQKLKQALRACHALKQKKRRAACEKSAHRRYAKPKARSKSKKR